jgi:vacuolar-type H+-ATPase subunit I/STV1
MSIPANALSDEECLHYAALDPAAAAELTRRLTAQSIDPSAEREELREDIRQLESRIEDSDDELDNLRDGADEACSWIKRAMDPGDRELSLNALLQKALDCLE